MRHVISDNDKRGVCTCVSYTKAQNGKMIQTDARRAVSLQQLNASLYFGRNLDCIQFYVKMFLNWLRTSCAVSITTVAS